MIEEWIKNVSVYPPAEIYAGLPQGKAEKRAVTICEDLYKFNYGKERNVLSDLRAAWREFEVLLILSKTGKFIPVKQERSDAVCDAFLKSAQTVINRLDAMHKQHQDLNQYYKNWRVGYQDLKVEALTLKRDLT